MVQLQVERVDLPFENESSRFFLSKEDKVGAFQKQYFHMYRTRLDLMKPRILEQAKAQLGNVKYRQLENLSRNEMVLIIGTIEKRISQRPSILKELAEDERMIPDDVDDDADAVTNLVSSKDFLEFEDEKQIVKLSGNITMNDVATGCTVGLYGKQVDDDVFLVESLIWPSVAPPSPFPKIHTNGTIMFISGLELTGNPATDKETTLAFTCLSRWLNGEMAVGEADSEMAATVDRLVIAGESIGVKQAREFSSAVSHLRLIRSDVSPAPASVAALDSLLAKLTSKMCVNLMSGAGDPATQLWPQQPIHRACLPLASVNGAALGLVTNPFHFKLGGVEIVATSGQNVTDIRRLSDVTSSCDIMSKLLEWQHLAPTAPDTVDAFPMDGRDPFLMSSVPHVMVAGNQPKPESRLEETPTGNCVLLSLPRFSRSKMAALVNLDTLEVKWRTFGI